MRIAIVGSRNINDYDLVERTIVAHVGDLSGVTIVSGGARGVDTIARRIAKNHSLPLIEHLPDYKQYGKVAPLIRNTYIVSDADIVFAFSAKDRYGNLSRGTEDAVLKAMRMGKTVIITEPKG